MELRNDRTFRDESEKLALHGEWEGYDEGQENGHLKDQEKEDLSQNHVLSA